MFSKSLIQFSIDGWSCVPFLLFIWGQTMVEVIEIMVTSFKRSHACTATFSAPNPAEGHRQSMPPIGISGHSQASLGQCLVGSLLLSPGSWCTRFCWCPPRVYFPVLCNGEVTGDLLQEGLCHTQVCCIQSPCPCGSPLLTRTSTGEAQTQYCLCLCGSLGSGCAQGLFEPSEHLWGEGGLILTMNSPLYHLAWASPLPSGVGYLLTAPVLHSGRWLQHRASQKLEPLI